MVRGRYMGSSRRYVFFVLVCMLLPLLLSPIVTARSHTDSRQLTIFQDDGLVFEETLSLNGTSNYQLANSNWFLMNLFDEAKSVLATGTLSNVMAIGEGEWAWSLELNVSMYNCTCGFRISDDSPTHPSFQHHGDNDGSLIVYLGSNNHQPYILPFNPVGPNMVSDRYLLTNENIELKVPLILPAGLANDTFVHLEVCSVGWIICLDEMVSFDDYLIVQEGRELSLIFEREGLNLSDGYWMFSITVNDALLHSSNIEYFVILIDQNIPTVSLSCDREEINSSISNGELLPATISIEEFSPISFSAIVTDGYSSGDNILTWTLLLPDGSRRALLPVEIVSENLISVKPDLAGTWSVELLVRDTAGWLVHSSIDFEVYNMVPSIQLELDSFVVTEGSTVSLTEGEEWELNSSKSFDTANDNSDLLYTWYVNGNTFLTGKSTLQSSDFNEPGTYELRLVIEDDDGAQSEVSFDVLISEARTSEDSNVDSMIVSVSIIILLLFITGFLVRTSRRHTGQTTVPKWNANQSFVESTENEETEL